ncbi:phosphoenolpyruvate synthase [Candidatus Nomurabacteria bacterium]|nr:phosphoenolpyruvate synthase [Candidatus Nomurabacteria bacterium]
MRKKPTKLKSEKTILWFEEIGIQDIPFVGGKNASLGEMYNALSKKGVVIPGGFAVTAYAYQTFLQENNLEKKIKKQLSGLHVENVKMLKARGKAIRSLMLKAKMPEALKDDIFEAYEELAGRLSTKRLSVAVRSSATAEDLPGASFAGQQETFLNIVGKQELALHVQKCFASLFTDRAISYREGQGFQHMDVSLSVTVQQMVRSDLGSSGVMFTLDTESGFRGVTLVTAAYGLGEYVVQGRVTPDQFYVFKEGLKKGVNNPIISRTLGSKEVKLVYSTSRPTKQEKVPQKDRLSFAISQKDVIQLAKWGQIIEDHYQKPQDIEWAKDGKTGKLYIVQARPETVKANVTQAYLEEYILKKKGKELARGISVGQRIGAGRVRVIERPSQMRHFQKGEVLVTKITDPDWEPIMRKASAIITEQGGKTSHAAIVSRELGVPCIVGVKDARKKCRTGKKITASCASGDEGVIYEGILPYEVKRTKVEHIADTKTKIMMNVGDPDHAFSLSHLPSDGVGLARLEFIFTNFIRIHPLALVHFRKLKDKKAKKEISKMTRGYTKKTDYCVEKLSEGVARIAAAFYPKPVIVRLSDFKTNEYATLLGGKEFERNEENPMIGFRGASRYYSPEYKEGFKLECEAIARVRNEMGLGNVIVMVPFCRTPDEGKKVLDTMATFGLRKGDNGLKVYVMCEIPSNVILATEFAKLFDGMSIGSNDLTQLTLGLDRDTSSESLTHIGDATHPAVKQLIAQVIHVAKKHKKKIGICGQAPSDYPEFASFLVKQGIDSISLNPDTLIETQKRIARLEGKRTKGVKADGRRLGVFATFAFMCASVITLASGCAYSSQQKMLSSNVSLANAPAPALIREKVEQKEKETLEEMKQQIKDEIMQSLGFGVMSRFEGEIGGIDLSFSYPSGWNVHVDAAQVRVSQGSDSDDEKWFAIEAISAQEAQQWYEDYLLLGLDDQPPAGKYWEMLGDQTWDGQADETIRIRITKQQNQFISLIGSKDIFSQIEQSFEFDG